MIKKYSKVLLVNGQKATIVEILEKGKAYIADIEVEDDYETETIYQKDIKTITEM